jgi:hypothetical protein
MRTRADQCITDFARIFAILIRNARGHIKRAEEKKTTRHKPARRTIVFLEMP